MFSGNVFYNLLNRISRNAKETWRVEHDSATGVCVPYLRGGRKLASSQDQRGAHQDARQQTRNPIPRASLFTLSHYPLFQGESRSYRPQVIGLHPKFGLCSLCRSSTYLTLVSLLLSWFLFNINRTANLKAQIEVGQEWLFLFCFSSVWVPNPV